MEDSFFVGIRANWRDWRATECARLSRDHAIGVGRELARALKGARKRAAYSGGRKRAAYGLTIY